MKTPKLILGSLALSLGACCAPGAIPAPDLDPALPLILERYEAYVESGAKPDGSAFQQDDLVDEKAVWLNTAAELRAYLEAALAAAQEAGQ